jgi:hypothetical protein
MPDYDVQVTALAVPPIAAPVAAYRPAVSVRNNGLYPADITGQIRVYRREPPGDLLDTFAITLTNLQPGATGSAQAALFWTPTPADIGREYLFTADISSAGDQDETNNHLGPTTVLVIPGAPPIVPTVEPHSPQHEAGGTDQINLDNLLGKAADPQTPDTHADAHEAGGTDQINVGALQGVLAQDQPAAPHGNSRHSPAMSLASELTTHATATTAHPAATNLANRETTGLDVGLVPSTQLATESEVLNGRKFLERGDNPGDRQWSVPVPQGLICVWPAGTAVPTGWADAGILPAPALLYIWIVKL